jgi:hypothetical protein
VYGSPVLGDGVEVVLNPRGEVLVLCGDGTLASPGRGLELRLGREAHRLGYGSELLVSGTLYAVLEKVGDVGAGHDPTRGLVELLARSPAPVQTPIGIRHSNFSETYMRFKILEASTFKNYNSGPNHCQNSRKR